MTKFKRMKRELETLLLPPSWPEDARMIPEKADALRGMEAVNPLLALLPRGGLLTWRAVVMLGRVTERLAETAMEDARTVMRRCMWHLNEDSGNMGWGVAEAMGEILARSPALAKEYGRVSLSYARDTGFADNFIDHAALRRGAYWAIGRFSPLYPEYRDEGAELLLRGLEDEDAQSRGISAWGIGRLARQGAFTDAALREGATAKLARITDQDLCEVLDGLQRCAEPAASFARQALSLVAGSGGS